MSFRLVDSDVTRLLAVVGGVPDIHHISEDDVDTAIDFTCGVVAGYSLGMQASDSITNVRGVCDRGNVVARGNANYQGSIQIFVEGDPEATAQDSPIIRAKNLFNTSGVIVDIIRLIGKPSGTPVTAGEEYEAYRFLTDYLQKQSGSGDSGYMVWQADLLQQGQFEDNGVIVAGS